MKIEKPKKIKKPRKPLRKRRKRSPKAILFDRVWRKCSEYVRRRDQGVCYTCGDRKDWKYQDAGHFIHGKTKPTYFDTRQIKCQCQRCNHFLSGNLGVYGVKLARELNWEVIKPESFESRSENAPISVLKINDGPAYYQVNIVNSVIEAQLWVGNRAL